MQTQRDLWTTLLLKYHDGVSGNPAEAVVTELDRGEVEATTPTHLVMRTGQTVLEICFYLRYLW